MSNMSLIPNKIDFDKTLLALDSQQRSLKIVNCGSSSLNITNIALKKEDSNFKLTEESLPIVIPAPNISISSALSYVSGVRQLLVYDDKIILISASGVISIYSVNSSTGALTLLQSTSSGLSILSAIIVNNYIICACGTSGIISIRINSDNTCTTVQIASLAGDVVNSVVERNNNLYVASDVSGLSVWKLNSTLGTFIFMYNNVQSGSFKKVLITNNNIIVRSSGAGIYVYTYTSSEVILQSFTAFSTVVDVETLENINCVIAIASTSIKLYFIDNNCLTLKTTISGTAIIDNYYRVSYDGEFVHLFNIGTIKSHTVLGINYNYATVSILSTVFTYSMFSFCKYDEEFSYFVHSFTSIQCVKKTDAHRKELLIIANIQSLGEYIDECEITSDASLSPESSELRAFCIGNDEYGVGAINYSEYSNTLVLSQYKE